MFADYEALVTDLVRDDANRVSPLQLESAIALAVTRYGEDRPRPKVEDVAGLSGNLIALPAGWETDFSALKSIEYPVGNVPPTYIDAQRYGLYATPSGGQIMLLDALPQNATVRLMYTVRHQVDAATDTVPPARREAVAKWAAAHLCEQLAALYANEQDSTIAADSVRQSSKSAEYARRARDYRNFYLAALGIDEKTAAPSGTIVNLDALDSRGEDYLFHGRRRR